MIYKETEEFQRWLIQQGFPVANLIDEIASDENIEDSFDYVVSHLEHEKQRRKYRKLKDEYCKRLKYELSTGTFRITDANFHDIEVEDGPKHRICQCPEVYHRVGCHAVMVVFEKYTYPTLIKNTAASIKGRGMHWLHQIVEEDLDADPDGMRFYYQSDIFHFYDCIVQGILKQQVRLYTSDRLVLGMLDNFMTLLPYGISKGLRASQCLANLHLNEVDHAMCNVVSYHEIEDEDAEDGRGVAVSGAGCVVIKGKEIRYHYYRYCDDIVIFAATKKELWMVRNYLHSLLERLSLTIKPSEAVRPRSEGLDYLGYKTNRNDVTGEVYSGIRKRTKQKFARRLKRVKSRKRRKALIGSFFGMAAHADCKHLLKTLLAPSEYKRLKWKRKMYDYDEYKISEPRTSDNKKIFKGTKLNMTEADHKAVIILDVERDVIPKWDNDDYQHRLQAASAQKIDPNLVEKPKPKYIMSVIFEKKLRKMWTGDRERWQELDDMEAQGFPAHVGIVVDYSSQYKKMLFVSPKSLGISKPTEAELRELEILLNVKLL